MIDLTGRRFGRLTVVGISTRPDSGKQRGIRWLCKCDCGNEHIVISKNLTSGHVKSCGCLHDDLSAMRITKMNYKHGKSKTRLYKIWTDMKKRCNNSNHWAFGDYGGRGIKYAEEWNEFEPFENWSLENGYAEALTLDRIDNNSNYSPNNCRWVDRKVQANNRRNNVRYEYRGETHTLPELSELYGVSIYVLRGRIYRGWDIARAIETPVREVRRHGT